VPDLEQLQSRLGYQFIDDELIRLALTHPSVAHEQGITVEHNQRLEFLGDAVLQLVLTAELYQKFPDVGEGPLTTARAELVNRRSLARQALLLELGDHLWLSRGEESSGGRGRTSTLADAYEAVLGAIFLDAGFEVVRKLLLSQFREVFGELEVIPNLKNPKGDLQELLQSHFAEGPRYEMVSVKGPDHDREFECSVYHGHRELARGVGKSKKAAESQAAMQALKQLQLEADTQENCV